MLSLVINMPLVHSKLTFIPNCMCRYCLRHYDVVKGSRTLLFIKFCYFELQTTNISFLEDVRGYDVITLTRQQNETALENALLASL